MFEQFLSSHSVKKHPLYAFFLGLFYVFVGYLVAYFFFTTALSVAIMFTCTLLLVPSVYAILATEEKIESRHGTKHFLHDHEDIFLIFLFLFLGIFCGYMFLGYSSSFGDAVAYQMNFLKARGDLSSGILAGNIPEANHGLGNFLGLLSDNLLVVVICFLLSVFYGAGALFLITLNASIFSVYAVTLAKHFSFSIVGAFLVHLIPELSGFLAASIAGGVISRAIMKEKFGSKQFANVFKDGCLLLVLSFALIALGAFLEIFVTSEIARAIIS